MQRFARTERRRWFKPKHYSNSYTPDFAFVYQQNSSVILECYDDEKKCWVMLPYCDFPIIKCAVTVLPVLGLTSHHDVTRLCGVITAQQHGVFVHCMIQSTYSFNKMASEISISVDL